VPKPWAWIAVLAAAVPVLAQPADAPPFLTRVSTYVEEYYARVQRVIVDETVVIQPLKTDLSPDGFARRLVYETRLEWDPAAAEPARVTRELVRAQGPRFARPNKPECFDPRAVSPEPLAFLLPARHEALRFRVLRPEAVRGRPAQVLEFTPRRRDPPKVDWEEDCGRVDLAGHIRGRVWADARSGEVLRVTEQLIGPVDIRAPRESSSLWFTFDRQDTVLDYQQVRFENPEETLLLPQRVDVVSVVLRSGMPRLRLTLTYDNYRRFVTESRIVE
jgi:hypothetical protein